MHLRLILVFALVTESLTLSNIVTEKTVEEALHKWNKMEDKMICGMNSLVKMITPFLQDDKVQLSPQCSHDILEVVVDVQDFKLWAFKMIDSIGKPYGAEMEGRFGTYGNFHECLDVVFPGNDADKTVGQYCLLDIHFPLPPKKGKLRSNMDIFEGQNVTFKYEVIQHLREKAAIGYELPLRFGVCIPSTCTKEDLLKVARSAVVDFGLTPAVVSCDVKQPIQFDALHIAIMVIFAAFTVVVIVSALVGQCPEMRFNKIFPIEDFNPIRNLRSTMKTNSDNGNILECLNGLRAISFSWIILTHTYGLFDPLILRNLLFSDQLQNDWAFVAVINSQNSLDTFLLITGLITAYSLVSKVDRTGVKSFNIPMMILRRVLRFLPSLFVIIGIAILIPTTMSLSGPLWNDIMGNFEHNCREQWWKNVLFINNFESIDRLCLPHSYYISLDMQCLLIIIVYFWLLFKKPAYGYSYLVFLIVASALTNGILTDIFKLAPIPLITLEGHASFLQLTQILGSPHYRIGGYAIGALLGTVLARRKNIGMSKIQLTAGWSVATATALADVYGICQWVGGAPYEGFANVIYASLKGPAWSISVCWVVLVCATGHGGVVNEMLSWRGFQPLSRLNYLMYLTHLLLMYGYSGVLPDSIDFSHRTMVSIFFGCLVITFLASLVLRLVFEAPIINLEGRFFNNLYKKRAVAQTRPWPENETSQCETST